MQVHLDQSEPRVVRRRRHHAALAVRAGGGHAARVRRPADRRRNARDARLSSDPAGRRRRHRHPHRQRAARLRGRARGARSAARGSSSAASTPRSIPDEAHELGGAHAVVKGDGDARLADGRRATASPARRSRSTTAAGSTATTFLPARWDLLPRGPLHVGLGADRARLPEALLVLLGVADRRPGAAAARRRRAWSSEIVELRRRGFRFIALADDNFYPVTLDDLAHGARAAPITTRLARARRRSAPSASS